MVQGIDYPGVTCACICRDSAGRVLLSLRSDACRDEQGMWEFGGGGLELGETLEEHVRREMREELNIELGNLRMLGATTMLRPNAGKVSHWVLFVWTGIVSNLEALVIREPDRMVEYKWFDMDALPQNLHSSIPTILEIARKHETI